MGVQHVWENEGENGVKKKWERSVLRGEKKQCIRIAVAPNASPSAIT